MTSPSPFTPSAPRPALSLLGTEPWRALGEYLMLRWERPEALPGDGHPVIIFPGLASDGLAVAPLRRFCSSLGYAARDWGRGFNTGPGADLDGWLAELAAEVRRSLKPGSPAPSLIGWSLGGLYARELAKRADCPVRQVITIGTPFNGHPGQTHAGWLYRLLNGDSAEPSGALLRRLREPPPVPTTSIYSRSDGVVAWQACRHDRPRLGVEDVEVRGSHLGMGWNPRVLRIVAERLARPPGSAPAWYAHARSTAGTGVADLQDAPAIGRAAAT